MEEESRKVRTKQAKTGRHCPSGGLKKGPAAGLAVRSEASLLQLKHQVLRSEAGPQAEQARGAGGREGNESGGDKKAGSVERSRSPRSSRGRAGEGWKGCVRGSAGCKGGLWASGYLHMGTNRATWVKRQRHGVLWRNSTE